MVLAYCILVYDYENLANKPKVIPKDSLLKKASFYGTVSKALVQQSNSEPTFWMTFIGKYDVLKECFTKAAEYTNGKF